MIKNQKEIQHLTSADFKKAPFDKVILPLGSLESHGGHLPFGTDALTAHMIALDIAERVPGIAVLPAVPFGVSEHYKEFPFCISLQFETEIRLIRDILESIYREGIRKVFIMNGHDGNIAPIEVASRSAKVAHPDFRIVSLDAWWVLVGSLVPPGFFEVWNGLGHGGEGETSICLRALSGALVKCRTQKGSRRSCPIMSISNGASPNSPIQVPLVIPPKELQKKERQCAKS